MNSQQVQQWTLDLPGRLAEHAAGRGARLIAVAADAGIDWVLARIWEGTRDRERALKNTGGASRRCPRCRAQARCDAALAEAANAVRAAAAGAWVAPRTDFSPAARDYRDAVADEADVLVSLAQAVAADAPDAEVAAIRTLLAAVLDRRGAAARRLGIATSSLPPGAARLPGPGGAR